MKLLAFSDVHLDSKFGWASRDVARRQRQRLREGVTWAFEQARAEGAAAVLIGGDLFEHELVAPDTVAFLRRTFEQSGLQVFAAPGNHGLRGHGEPVPPGRLAGQRPRLPRDPLHAGAAGRRHHDLGRRPPQTRRHARFLRRRLPGRRRRPTANRPAATASTSPSSTARSGTPRSGGNTGTPPFDGDRIAAAGFDHAVVGHSHKPADRPGMDPPLGSLERLKFNEVYGSAVTLEIEDGRVTRRRLDPRPPALHTLSVDLTEVENPGQARDRVRDALSGMAGAARHPADRRTGRPSPARGRLRHQLVRTAGRNRAGTGRHLRSDSALRPGANRAGAHRTRHVRAARARRRPGPGDRADRAPRRPARARRPDRSRRCRRTPHERLGGRLPQVRGPRNRTRPGTTETPREDSTASAPTSSGSSTANSTWRPA